MTEQATAEMARYIWKILQTGGAVTMSWGIDPPDFVIASP